MGPLLRFNVFLAKNLDFYQGAYFLMAMVEIFSRKTTQEMGFVRESRKIFRCDDRQLKRHWRINYRDLRVKKPSARYHEEKIKKTSLVNRHTGRLNWKKVLRVPARKFPVGVATDAGYSNLQTLKKHLNFQRFLCSFIEESCRPENHFQCSFYDHPLDYKKLHTTEDIFLFALYNALIK